MATVVVELSPTTYEVLRQRARETGKSPEILSQELLEAALQRPRGQEGGQVHGEHARAVPGVATESGAMPTRTTQEILAAAGHVRPLGALLESMIIPGVTLEEVHAMTRGAGGPSGSEIILEQRGPKE